MRAKFVNETLSAQGAVLGFVAWLTGRKDRITMSEKDGAAEPLELALKFIKKQKLETKEDHNWVDDLIPMKDKKNIYENLSEKYKKNILKIYDAKTGDVVSNDVIYTFVEYICDKAGKYDECFIDGNLGKRLDKYDNYILKKINIDKLNLDEYNVDDYYVEEYKNLYLNAKIYPPIILDNNYIILDGLHRANALKRAGEKEILAFVGLKKQKTK